MKKRFMSGKIGLYDLVPTEEGREKFKVNTDEKKKQRQFRGSSPLYWPSEACAMFNFFRDIMLSTPKKPSYTSTWNCKHAKLWDAKTCLGIRMKDLI